LREIRYSFRLQETSALRKTVRNQKAQNGGGPPQGTPRQNSWRSNRLMSIPEKIDQDIKEALRGGKKDLLTVLRGLKSDLKYKEISAREAISDEMAVEVLAGAVKKRRESIEQFRKGERDDLVRKEEFELGVITGYLPEQLTEEKLRELARAAIDEVGAESPRQIGQVMKVLMPQVKGRADGKLVNKLITELLAN
jgi:uncharacterized protein YqeY